MAFIGSKFSKLGADDLLVVQLKDVMHDASRLDEVVSIKASTLSENLVELATPGTPENDYADGSAGVAYPGQGFYYDEATGQMDVKIDSDLSFQGVILHGGADTAGGGTSVTEWDTDLTTDINSNSISKTRRGNFYIVGQTGITLDPAVWYMKKSSDSVTSLGDLIICVDDSVSAAASGDYSTHEWNRIANVTGGQAVLQLKTSAVMPEKMSVDDHQRYSEIVTDGVNGTPQRPLIRLRKAAKYDSTVPGATKTYYGGLINEYHTEILEEFNLDVWQDGLVASLTIDSTPVSNAAAGAPEALVITRGGTHDPLGYPDLVLNANPSGVGVYGMIKIASQEEADCLWDTNYGVLGTVDEVAMTPQKVFDGYVPRMFSSLDNINSIP